jgi:hypothetical protein
MDALGFLQWQRLISINLVQLKGQVSINIESVDRKNQLDYVALIFQG